jgi:hypothetical protein
VNSIQKLYFNIYVYGTGQISLLSKTEEQLGKKSNGSGLENREYARRDPSS